MKNLGTKTIETKRLILRQFTIEDADAMYRNWANDSEVTKFLTWPTHSSVEVTKKVVSGWVDEYDKENRYHWCIAKKENNEPIGSITGAKLDEKIEQIEIGYCIGRAYWNQGFASEALFALIQFFFEEVGINRVEARHDTRNPHSGMVMEHCGMHREGILRMSARSNAGIGDIAVYGLLKKDIRNMKKFASVQPAADSEPETGKENVADTTGAQTKTKKDEARTPKNVISDETIDYVGILAKLELSPEEKEQAKKDMGEMLDYIDKLNELDTTGVEPMSHVFPVNNVFREDVVTNGDGSEATLKNAPVKKDGGFKVPKTIG